MRCLVVAAVLLLGGCPLTERGDATGSFDEPGADNGGVPEGGCAIDSDCELASASCCECPSFALATSDPATRACTGVVCPTPPVCAANLRAVCGPERTCEVACAPLTCEQTFAGGYAIDPATGCLSCEPAQPVMTDGCVVDEDCVQTRADCCGCARGGMDTAVLASAQPAYDQSLNMGMGCPTAPQCPGLDQCEAAAAPRCVQGSCRLTSAQLPANACGRADLPACTTCVVNRDPAATELGVGVCAP